jgi:dUTP pyrophosphatase
MNTLYIFKSKPEAIIPKYATTYSACFDLSACLTSDSLIKAFVPKQFGDKRFEDVSELFIENGRLTIPSMARVLVPTGLKFRIPINCSIRLHPRSGISIKNGLTLVNCEGVIDEDYFDEVFVPIHNISSFDQILTHGTRICQAELVVDSRATLIETDIEPTQKSNRVGGFGSTGTQS